MLLNEVKLKRFKAAFDPKPVRLGSFNVIIGRNGSGKSTLLEALQWLDVTLRRDAREASDRYFGTADLVNLRTQSTVPSFEVVLKWEAKDDGARTWRYKVQVEDRSGVAQVSREQLDRLGSKGRREKTFIATSRGERRVLPDGTPDSVGAFPIREPDRLALSRVGEATLVEGVEGPSFVTSFWNHAVFLRLSPNRLALGSPATRKSFEPLLDEEGQTLPALINDLNDEQRTSLIDALQEILEGIRAVEISSAGEGRDTRVHYSLREQMPYRGRAGRKPVPIPAWMLSEGTRRITAILSLLAHEPGPSLLCIEEVENGLDPWAVLAMLKHLQSAADRGVQVILTTHSPWLLDQVPLESIIWVRRIGGDSQYERFADNREVRSFDSSVPAGTRYTNLEEG
jgi:predicted ATPase